MGGAEQVVWQTIKGLSKYESIYLIVNNEITSYFTNILPDSNVLNIGDVYLHSKKTFRVVRFLLNNRYYSLIPFIIRLKSAKIGNYLRNNKIEILHSHLDYALYSSLYIKKINANIKLFHTVHGAFGLIEDKLLKPLLSLSRFDFSHVDKLIFVSQYNYNLYKSKNIFINDFKIIYNGIDFDNKGGYFRPVKTNKIFEILYVGGSKYVKGYDILVETVDLLRKSNCDVNFHVVVLGSITNNCELVNMIKQRGLEQYFNLIGFVDPPLHLSYFESADMLFMPSRSEAFPVAVIEAIFLDLPVIANNVGGIPEIIENGINGFLGNNMSQEYCSFILSLMENYNSFLLKAKNYNMKIKPKFNAINMYKRLLEIYS